MAVIGMGDDPSILPALQHGYVDAAALTTPARLVAKKAGFRELLDFDELGLEYPYIGVSSLKATVNANPEIALRLIRTLSDGIETFKNNKNESLRVMKRYLRGLDKGILEETYRYFASKTQKYSYPPWIQQEQPSR